MKPKRAARKHGKANIWVRRLAFKRSTVPRGRVVRQLHECAVIGAVADEELRAAAAVPEPVARPARRREDRPDRAERRGQIDAAENSSPASKCPTTASGPPAAGTRIGYLPQDDQFPDGTHVPARSIVAALGGRTISKTTSAKPGPRSR